MSREISQAGIDLITSFEGCQLKAYKATPTEAYYTIGYGHYGPDVTKDMVITQAKAEELLVGDLAEAVGHVNNTAYVPVTAQLNQNQFDALVDFCYNCGEGNLKTLCKDRSVAEIGTSITKYNKSGGVVMDGLVKRRAAELALFNKEVEESMTAAEQKEFDELKALVASLSKQVDSLNARLNINGDQTYASAYAEAVKAAENAGLIKTSADKSKIELNVIQMLHNIDLTDSKVIAALKALAQK